MSRVNFDKQFLTKQNTTSLSLLADRTVEEPIFQNSGYQQEGSFKYSISIVEWFAFQGEEARHVFTWFETFHILFCFTNKGEESLALFNAITVLI